MARPSYSKVKQEVLRRMEQQPTKGKIAAMSPQRKAEFERDIATKRLTIQQIAAKYGLSKTTVIAYRDNHVRPAIAMAAQNDKLDTGRNALGALWELHDEARGVIRDLRQNPDADPRKLGNVEQILGRAHDIVRTIGIGTAELLDKSVPVGGGDGGSGGGFKQVIKVISLPKTPGTPEFAVSVEQGPDYDNIDLIEAPEEEAIEV